MIVLFLRAHFRSLTETESGPSAYVNLLKNPLGDGQGQPNTRKTVNQDLPTPLRREEEILLSPEASDSQTDNISPDNTPRLDSLKRNLDASNWESTIRSALLIYTRQVSGISSENDPYNIQMLINPNIAKTLKTAREFVAVAPEREALSHLEASLSFLQRVVSTPSPSSLYFKRDEANESLVEKVERLEQSKEAITQALKELNRAIDASIGVPPGARREALILVCGAQLELIEQVDRHLDTAPDGPSQ
jgi:hypothetical protein